jgi:hypothetical protein
MKKFFENIDKLMKSQDSSMNERLFVVYARAVLNFHNFNVMCGCIFNNEISLIICNELIYLFKNYVLDKLYKELIGCNLEIDSLNNLDIITKLTPVINELYSMCNYLVQLQIT